MLKACLIVSVVVVAMIVGRVWHAASSIVPMSKLSNCNHIKSMGSIEDIVVDKRTGLAFFPTCSDLGAFYRKEPKRYGTNIYKADLNKDFSVDALEKVPVVGFDFDNVTLHGANLFVDEEDGSRVYLFLVAHAVDAEYVLIFEYKNEKLHFVESVTQPEWHSLNDVFAVGPRSFYTTHTFGSDSYFLLQMLLALPTGRVEYFDGTTSTVVASGIKSTNGIALSNDFSKVYVVSTVALELYEYSRDQKSGNLTFQTTTILGSSGDNIYVDEEDNLWIAAFPVPSMTVLDVLGVANIPTEILKVTTPNMKVEKIYTGDGSLISGVTIAVKYKQNFIASCVFHPHLMYCAL